MEVNAGTEGLVRLVIDESTRIMADLADRPRCRKSIGRRTLRMGRVGGGKRVGGELGNGRGNATLNQSHGYCASVREREKRARKGLFYSCGWWCYVADRLAKGTKKRMHRGKEQQRETRTTGGEC